MATAGLLARPAPAPSRFRSDINAGPLSNDLNFANDNILDFRELYGLQNFPHRTKKLISKTLS